MQLDLLWKFMQVDMEADHFENEMRQAPNRQKLLKHRDFLLEQQNNMKKIEDDVASMNDRLEVVSGEAARLEGLIAAQKQALEADAPEGQESIRETMTGIQKLLDSVNFYEQELSKTRKDAETRDRQQKEIRVRAAKAKAEYDQTKIVYDAEFKKDSEKLKQLRAKAEAATKGIDSKLLERYIAIKQHSTPPMAMLNGDQCAGCYMQLPSVTLRRIKAGEEVVECDNCGRILYVREG